MSQILIELGKAQREVERKVRPGMQPWAVSAIVLHECNTRELPYRLFLYLEAWALTHYCPGGANEDPQPGGATRAPVQQVGRNGRPQGRREARSSQAPRRQP